MYARPPGMNLRLCWREGVSRPTGLLPYVYLALAAAGNAAVPADPGCTSGAGSCHYSYYSEISMEVGKEVPPAFVRARVSRVSRVCPASPRCLFTGTSMEVGTTKHSNKEWPRRRRRCA